jgi:hypothetical protein
MHSPQTAFLPMLVEELRASLPNISEVIDQLAASQSNEQRRVLLRQLGALWFRQDGEPEVLAELGLALSELHGVEPGVALSELLLAYGAAREEQRTREWESHLVVAWRNSRVSTVSSPPPTPRSTWIHRCNWSSRRSLK